VGRRERLTILDTHVLLWLARGSERLGTRAASRIDRAAKRDGLALSVFSYWEIETLVQRGRVRFPSGADIRARVLGLGVTEIAVDAPIAITAARLRGFHGDPADRIIAATTLERGGTLVTADQRLLGWSGAPTVDATR
jgi:PIN domain nuclease of toxin-antitoxin system